MGVRSGGVNGAPAHRLTAVGEGNVALKAALATDVSATRLAAAAANRRGKHAEEDPV
jgi:hypothetical protein